MLAGLRRWCAARAMRRRIAALSEAERQAILAASPYESGWFQGEGFHVFRKDVPGMEGYVATVGEVNGRDAEDWLIRRYFEDAGVPPSA